MGGTSLPSLPSLPSFPTFGIGGGLGQAVKSAAGSGGRPSAPLLQGSAQIRRIRQAGSSLEPGQGQGFLGSIQAGADPNSFDELLLALLGNRNGLTGR